MNADPQESSSPQEVLQDVLSKVEEARNLPLDEVSYVERVRVLAKAVAIGACIKDTFHPQYKGIGFRPQPILEAASRAGGVLTASGTTGLLHAVSELATAVEMLLSQPGLSTRARDWLYSAGGVPRAVTELDLQIAGWLSATIVDVRHNAVVNRERWPSQLLLQHT